MLGFEDKLLIDFIIYSGCEFDEDEENEAKKYYEHYIEKPLWELILGGLFLYYK